MASSLEFNKVLAAFLTAGIVASGAGVLSRIIYHPTAPEEPAYHIEVAEADQGGGGEEEAAVPIGVLLASADPAAGEGVAKKCASCHAFEEGGANKVGPALYDVVGRDIASAPDFSYSPSLSELEGAWEYESLNDFLASPKGFVPGTKMAFAGVKDDQDRADLIMYLRSLAPEPAPLPEAPAETPPDAAEAPAGDRLESTAGPAGDAATSGAASAPVDPAPAEAADAETADTGGTGSAPAEPAQAAEEMTNAQEAPGQQEQASSTESTADAAASATETAMATAEAAKQATSEAAESVKRMADSAAQSTGEIIDQSSDAAADAAQQALTEAGRVAADLQQQVEAAREAVTGALADPSQEAPVEAAPQEASSGQEPVETAAVDPAAGGGIAARLASADVAKGETSAQKCKACHTFEENGPKRLGPPLWGVVGRDAGTVEGFRYSEAMEELGPWDFATLDGFLTAPRDFLKGTRMTFAGIKDDQERANLIAYLRSLSSDPVQLPAAGG